MKLHDAIAQNISHNLSILVECAPGCFVRLIVAAHHSVACRADLRTVDAGNDT
jgi:hypothetical protein